MIGPGSEWLWSLVSDVAIVITLVGLYAQVKAERATRVFDQTMSIRAEWASQAERHARLVALIDLEGRASEDGLPPSAYVVGNWFARLGYLVKFGHVGIDQVATVSADDVLWWWTTMEPFVQHDRARIGLPIMGDFEHLATEMARIWRTQLGEEYVVRESIADQIEDYTRLLQSRIDVERGVIPQRRQEGTAAASGSPQASA